MVSARKILVPLNIGSKDLNGVYHAMALAERMHAKVIILKIDLDENSGRSEMETWVEDALIDLMQSASIQGLQVSYHIAQDRLEKEITGLIEQESIDLLVFGADDERMTDTLQKLRSRIDIQFIQVKEKGNVHYV